MMTTPTPLPGLLSIQPRIFGDDRGYFFEAFNQNDFAAEGITEPFVQDNESMSKRGVLRGLHFQVPPNAQGKLVSVTAGAVYDVALDLRKNSPTYGRWYGEIIDAKKKNMLWIPAGFAHGFLTLEDDTIFRYKCTQVYSPVHERCLDFSDPTLDIAWEKAWYSYPGLAGTPFFPLVSSKDKAGSDWLTFDSPF